MHNQQMRKKVYLKEVIFPIILCYSRVSPNRHASHRTMKPPLAPANVNQDISDLNNLMMRTYFFYWNSSCSCWDIRSHYGKINVSLSFPLSPQPFPYSYMTLHGKKTDNFSCGPNLQSKNSFGNWAKEHRLINAKILYLYKYARDNKVTLEKESITQELSL